MKKWVALFLVLAWSCVFSSLWACFHLIFGGVCALLLCGERRT